MVLDEVREHHERADSAYNAAMEEKRAAALGGGVASLGASAW